MSLNGWNVGVLAVGYLTSLVVGHFIVNQIIARLMKRYLSSFPYDLTLPAIMGVLDRFLFTTAYLIGVKEFIAIWLAFKVAGEWSPSQNAVNRPLYYIVLIGNGLNVIISVVTAILIQSFLRP